MLPTPSNLEASFTRRDNQRLFHLVPIEELRLQRAFLRYELCCRLVGIPSFTVANALTNNVYAVERLDLAEELSRILPPWELEEIVCVRTCVWRQYETIAVRVLDELRREITALTLLSFAAQDTRETRMSVRRLLRRCPSRDPSDYPFDGDLAVEPFWLDSM